MNKSDKNFNFFKRMFWFSTGKHLIVCESARNSFEDILNLLGGPNEKSRGQKLLKMIDVLPDLNSNEEKMVWNGKKLRLGRKIQERTHKIFSFGLYHKAVTVTANKAAIRAVNMQVII